METNHTLSIGCAILAGGKSTRMHRDKALLELDGIPYIQRIANQLGDFRERILSGNSKELSQSIGFRHVPDLFPDCGPMSGIYSALQASTSDAVFFVACDVESIVLKADARAVCNAVERIGCDVNGNFCF